MGKEIFFFFLENIKELCCRNGKSQVLIGEGVGPGRQTNGQETVRGQIDINTAGEGQADTRTAAPANAMLKKRNIGKYKHNIICLVHE